MQEIMGESDELDPDLRIRRSQKYYLKNSQQTVNVMLFDFGGVLVEDERGTIWLMTERDFTNDYYGTPKPRVELKLKAGQRWRWGEVTLEILCVGKEQSFCKWVSAGESEAIFRNEYLLKNYERLD